MDNKQQIFHIYKITNNVNGKIYIGQTSKTIEWRFKGHVYNAKCGGQNYFYTAIRKYDKENFSIESLCSCQSKKNADRLEVMFIKKFDSMNPKIGYNMTVGGEGGLQTQEVRDKIALTKSGMDLRHTPEAKEKISAAMKIIAQSEEFKQRSSLSGKKNKGRKMTPEQCLKISKGIQAISQTEEFKAKARYARSQVKNPKGPPKRNIPHNRIGCYKICIKTGEVLFRYKSYLEAHKDGFLKVDRFINNKEDKFHKGYFWAKEGELNEFDLLAEQKLLAFKFNRRSEITLLKRTPILIHLNNENVKIVKDVRELKNFLELEGNCGTFLKNIRNNEKIKGYNCNFI